MFITQLTLVHFRNIHQADLHFTKNINIFYGNNAQGKTNVVEAVSFLSMMKSFREEEDRILIHNESDFAKIQANFISNRIRHQVSVLLEKKDKTIQFDGEKNIPSSEFIGSVNVVTFVPSDVTLFKESPKERRDFLDDELGKLSPLYHYTRLQANQWLKERNELLKQDPLDDVLLQVVSEPYCQLNLELMKRRSEFIHKLNHYLTDKYRQLAKDNTQEVEIEYRTFLEEKDFEFERVKEKVRQNVEEDKRRQATQLGIHRDDFVVYLNNLDVSKFGSQGQMRLCAIALKLALIEVIKEKNEDDAIIVLDDVLSELDTTRQQALIQYLTSKNQILLTTAHVEEIKNSLQAFDCDYWLVEQGVIQKEDSPYGK